MGRQVTCGITLLCFAVFCVSCVSTRVINPSATELPGGSQTIVGLQTKAGDYLNVDESRYAGIRDGVVSGFAFTRIVEINRSDFEISEQRWESGKKRISIVKTQDGKTYRVSSMAAQGDRVRLTVETPYSVPFNIPVSDVELVWIKKSDSLASLVVVVGIIAGAFALLAAIAAATKESCPFVYSHDGRAFVFDAEPYGGATCPGLQRTEWCALEQLRPVGGRYRILIANEVDETQYTDEVKLLAIDHPPGTQVAADVDGGIHTLGMPLPPERAYDQAGASIVAQVAADDRVFWTTPGDALDPDRRAGMRDELTFEFAKPADARTAKIVFNGCNTLWASQMLRRFLELWGGNVGAYYQALNERGPFALAILEWNHRVEMCLLQLRLETPSGWRTAGTMVGGGPFVSESKVYVVDVGDVPGDRLRIRLTPPAGFWMINHIAVDYSPDLPVQVAELAASRGEDSQGQDALGLLECTDGRYLRMPEIGDRALLEFAAPLGREGWQRSVMLKASGYYDIHLAAQGDGQPGLLDRLRADPEFAIDYSLREYQKWRQEMQRSAQPPR